MECARVCGNQVNCILAYRRLVKGCWGGERGELEKLRLALVKKVGGACSARLVANGGGDG